MKRSLFFSRLALLLVIFASMVIGPTLLADGGANHQQPSTSFGVSGGNINDITRSFCCSGTLGSLVKNSAGVLYILSNNHVLARSDQAAAGEDISQPGMIDNGCRVPPIVADFTVAAQLGSNVDAAIAALRPNTMSTSGAILDIGVPSNVVRNPSVGLSVAKSGRTTGFTTSSISSINTSVSVQYQKNCGSGKKFVVNYTNQVVINSTTFSAGGDSGSLIVTNDSCHQPVALLYAGSSSSTIGNPVGEVLSKVGAALGSTLSFVGNACGTPNSLSPSSFGKQTPVPSDEAVEFATKVMKGREANLMSRPSVIGVGVGALDSDSNEAAIIVYIDNTTNTTPKLPRRINGVRVKKVYTDPFIAY